MNFELIIPEKMWRNMDRVDKCNFIDLKNKLCAYKENNLGLGELENVFRNKN